MMAVDLTVESCRCTAVWLLLAMRQTEIPSMGLEPVMDVILSCFSNVWFSIEGYCYLQEE